MAAWCLARWGRRARLGGLAADEGAVEVYEDGELRGTTVCGVVAT
jgi:hypothetical protein